MCRKPRKSRKAAVTASATPVVATNVVTVIVRVAAIVTKVAIANSASRAKHVSLVKPANHVRNASLVRHVNSANRESRVAKVVARVVKTAVPPLKVVVSKSKDARKVLKHVHHVSPANLVNPESHVVIVARALSVDRASAAKKLLHRLWLLKKALLSMQSSGLPHRRPELPLKAASVVHVVAVIRAIVASAHRANAISRC